MASASAIGTTGVHKWPTWERLNRTKTNLFTRASIFENNILSFLKVESLYLEDVLDRIDNNPTIKIFAGTDPTVTATATATGINIPNKNKTKKRLRLKNEENRYDIYIVVSLDLTKKEIKTGNTKVNTSNQICWKWGSEKQFFDYLNVLVDQLTFDEKTKRGKTLQEYAGNKPMDALKNLWRQYRDDLTPIKENITINISSDETTSLKKRIKTNNTILPNKFTNKEQYVKIDYLIAFILNLYDPMMNKKYRGTFYLYHGYYSPTTPPTTPSSRQPNASQSYGAIKNEFKSFIVQNLEFLKGSNITELISIPDIFTKNTFNQNQIAKRQKTIQDLYTINNLFKLNNGTSRYIQNNDLPLIPKLPRKERLALEVLLSLPDDTKQILIKIKGNNLYVKKSQITPFFALLKKKKNGEHIIERDYHNFVVVTPVVQDNIIEIK